MAFPVTKETNMQQEIARYWQNLGTSKPETITQYNIPIAFQYTAVYRISIQNTLDEMSPLDTQVALSKFENSTSKQLKDAVLQNIVLTHQQKCLIDESASEITWTQLAN